MQVKGLQAEYNRLLDSSGGAEGQNAAVQVHRAAFECRVIQQGCISGRQTWTLSQIPLSRILRCLVAAEARAFEAFALATPIPCGGGGAGQAAEGEAGSSGGQGGRAGGGPRCTGSCGARFAGADVLCPGDVHLLGSRPAAHIGDQRVRQHF